MPNANARTDFTEINDHARAPELGSIGGTPHAASGLNTMWLTTPEAADVLCLAASTLEKMRVTGGGPRFAKLGRAVRYRLTDLDAWAADRMRSSTSDPGGFRP